MTTDKNLRELKLKETVANWLCADPGWPASRAADAVCRATLNYLQDEGGLQ